MLTSSYLLWLLSATLILTEATTFDEQCLKNCADYSITLGHCRGAFAFNPHQTNVSYATEFVKCICDGQRDDGVLGFEPMLAAVETCSTCYQTPNVIRGDLNQLLDICPKIASGETTRDVLSFAPFGYTIIDWNSGKNPKEQGPVQALSA